MRELTPARNGRKSQPEPMMSHLLLVLSSLTLCWPAQATDFAPIEVGNRWVYVHEIYDGQHVGSYSIDTCTVEITQASFQTDGARSYFAKGIGGPCWRGGEANLRKDEFDNIIMRSAEPLQKPDTSAFLSEHPGFADAFRERVASWPTADNEFVYIDFSLDAASEDPFTNTYLNWYGHYVDSLLGYHTVRTGQGESDQWPWSEFERPVPQRFRHGARRSVVSVQSSVIAIESNGASLFEEGLGLVAEYSQSVITIGHSTTVLLWASVDGIEYGDRATAAEVDSWARVKRHCQRSAR